MLQPDKGRLSFRLGIALAAVTSLLIMWTTIVRDDSGGAAAIMLIMAAAVGSFTARFQPAGMARAMVGVAVMQAALGALSATAPITAAYPDGPLKAMVFNAVFSLLWLGTAALFRAAGRGRAPRGPDRALSPGQSPHRFRRR